jgi:Uncharacterized protein conserved in bacteria
MRWILVLLIAANVAFPLWRMLSAPPRPLPTEIVERPPVSAGKSLLLLHELDPAQVHERPEQPVDRPPSLCLMVGAFASKDEVRQFMARLAALDVISFEHAVDLPAGEGYWVYLQPLSNRDAARRRLAELHARGVDSYIIPKGELENGISLGVFTRRDLAEARLAELARLGLSAKLHNIERSYRELWVMLGEAEEHKLDESVWRSLAQENISLQRRQNLCSAVASAKNFH